MTDNDRQLLIFASEVAGIKIESITSNGLYFGGLEGRIWNPLECDGDALRLAVKLKISIYADDDSYVFAVEKEQRKAETSDKETHLGWCECWNDDPAADTRRAIVRAAAEIAIKLVKTL